jgi:hypothetical protein
VSYPDHILGRNGMSAETAHRKGHDGVIMAKRWLESTTRFRIHFSVYESEANCTVQLFGGKAKVFDMRGVHIDDDGSTNRCPLYVEVKNYDNAGDQGGEYEKYLQNCYLAAAREAEDGADRKTEFMWLTWHPFSQKKWSALCSEEELRDALAKLELEMIDDTIVRALSERLWLVVLSRRQDDMTMGVDLLGEIRKVVTQKVMP